MSDASVQNGSKAYAEGDRSAYFEQRLFVFSPLSTFWTTFVIFAILLGSFLAIATFENLALLGRDAAGVTIEEPLRTAFDLSLMVSVALFFQRFMRVRERDEVAAFVRTLRPGALEEHNLFSLTPSAAKLGPASVIGLAVGIVASWPLYRGYLAHNAPLTGVFFWFTIVTTALIMAFTRGVELSRTGTRGAIGKDLVVDLLRIERLSVWGRSAARFSLIWFTVSAVSCLFFLDSGLNIFTISMLAVLLALGVWVFLRTMKPVHDKIRAVKAAELERIRGEIATLRDAAAFDASAAARLQGLLAYEARIAHVQEWPFDQTTAMRVGASALILTVPWFGQAIAQFAIEHLAH